MSITKEVLEVEETLNKKIKNVLLFLGIKASIKQGNIINIDNTNLAYIEPHKAIIGNQIILFFNGTTDIFLGNLTNKYNLRDLEKLIKKVKV